MKYLACVFLCIIFSTTHSTAQVNLANGLVTYLPFDGNSLDASGNNNNGIPQNGIQLTTDRFGTVNSAYLFDGLNDHITIRDQVGNFTSTPFSTVLWFQTQSTDFQVMIGKRDFGSTNGQQFQLSIFRPGDGLFSSVTSNALPCSGDLTNSVLSMTRYTTPFCNDRWHNVIVTFDGLVHKMYLDGNLVSQNIPNFNAMMQCNSDIRLGNWWSGDPLWFKGKLDDFRWYNRVLTNDEIAVLSQGSNAAETYDFTFQKQICATPQVRFVSTTPVNSSIQWQFGDGTVSSEFNPVHVYGENRIYQVKMISGNITGCIDTVVKNVDLSFAYRNFILTAADTTICEGDSVFLRLERTEDYVAYCWKLQPSLFFDQNNGDYAKPNTKTTYIIIQSTQTGFFYDSVTIDISKAAIVASNDTGICKNEAVQLNADGGTTYIWSPASGLSDPTIANPIANPAVTTRYTVRSLVNGSCMAKDSVLVTINPLPVVFTNNEASTCPGFPAQLTATGGIKYQWSPSQTLSDASSPNPLASPTANTTYAVVVTDVNGCSENGEVKVSIAPTGKIYIPNAFTPNSDGINDCFSIKGAQGSSVFELAIYNRFGEKVFYTNNPSNCWDGSFKGKPQPTGSFAYTLKTSGPCGAFTEKGTVTVIR